MRQTTAEPVETGKPALLPPDSLPTVSTPAFLGAVLGIVTLAGLSYLALAVMSAKFSRAEVFFAECAREMLQTHNLVTPLYHGEAFFDKPILVYWLILASFKTLGVSHWAARLPSIAAATATIALTALGTARLFGQRAGLLAGMALASSFMYLSFASLCMSDMTLVFLSTCALSLFFAACSHAQYKNIGLWLGALCLGLGFLTKGPIGIVLPSVCFSLYLTLTKQWHQIRWHHYLAGAVIIVLAALPWFSAALRVDGIGALTYFFVRENFQRFTGALYDTHKPFWFSAESLLLGFAPWSLFLFPALKGVAHEWTEAASRHKPLLMAWLWVATVVGFFTVSKGKMDYYLLPAYPAAAMIVGVYLSSAFQKASRFTRGVAWAIALFLAVAAGLCAYTLPRFLSNVPFSGWCMFPLVLLVGALAMIYFMRKRSYTAAYACVFVAICSASMAFSLQICPWLLEKQAVLSYARQIADSPPDTRIGVYTSLDNWIDEITFETGKEPLRIRSVNQAHLFIKTKGPVLLLIPEDVFNHIPERPRHRRTIILGKRTFIANRLTPGFMVEHNADMTSGPKLLLLKNRIIKD